MTTVAIVYFSGYGHTERLADAVRAGIEAAGAEADVIRISDTGEAGDDALDRVAAADAVIYGCPTYMGGPPWQFKRFADSTSKVWPGQAWKDKIAAGFTNSGSLNGDKWSTMAYLWTLSQQHGQVWVGLGMLPANKVASGPTDLNRAGSFGGVFGISPADSSPDQGPLPGDIETARALGDRIVAVARRFAAG